MHPHAYDLRETRIYQNDEFRGGDLHDVRPADNDVLLREYCGPRVVEIPYEFSQFNEMMRISKENCERVFLTQLREAIDLRAFAKLYCPEIWFNDSP